MRWISTWLVLTMGAVLSPVVSAADEAAQKLRVDADRLIYDTTIEIDGREADIDSSDIEPMLALLRANPEIRTLELNSTGGGYYAAFDISDIVIDFELDTHVNGVCSSSCVTILLGGQKRTMRRGSKIGFHQVYWSAGSIQSYYDSNREDEGWTSPFDFAEWMYLDTQTEVYNALAYMIRRGVDPAFAVETIKEQSEGMWYPYRTVLLAAGVLTE